jgi:hypothetical protein
MAFNILREKERKKRIGKKAHGKEKETKAKMYEGSYVVVVARSRLPTRCRKRHTYSTNTVFYHRLSPYFLHSIAYCVFVVLLLS